MIGSFPQMPIKKASEQVTAIDDYKNVFDRFVTVTIKLDEFASLASKKGFPFAEAALAMFCDNLNGLLIGSKSIYRIDISTIFVIVGCNVVDKREFIEQRIRNAINSAASGGGQARCSFAVYPDDGKSSESLLLRMKATMPASWSENGAVLMNGVNFKNEIANGNVLTYVQGVYDVNRNLRGVEMLARWKNSEVGIVPPSEFLEAIQSQNASVTFLGLLLNNAKLILGMLQERIKKDVIVSVNINPINLMDTNFRGALEDFAQNFNVSNIELELVESDDFGKFLGFNEVVRGLAKLGYRLAIDDFGSRYAWINSLGEHVSTIKLDRTLTQRISKGSNASRAEVVVRSIVSMANSINIEVIAEGIEDKEDFNIMKNFGVTGMQGYYFGTPLLPEQFIENHVVIQENKQIFDELDKTSTLYDSFNNKRH